MVAKKQNDLEEIEQMILDCKNRESKLSEWQSNFIKSVSQQINNKSLTEKQIKTLESIWDRVTEC